MEIEIVPIKLEEDIFDKYQNELLKLQTSKYCYVTNINLISKLLTIELPLDNKRISIKNILLFLTWIDTQIKMNATSLLPISSLILIEFFGRDTYKKYMDILEDLKVVSDVPYKNGKFYEIGSNCKQYRIHTSYLERKDLCLVILNNDRRRDEFTCDINIDKRFELTIKKLDVNMRDAIQAEIEHCKLNNLSLNNLRIRLSRIFYTRMKRYIKKGKNVDRIYHSFSNLSRISRKYLNIKMYNIDISNSQPLFLVSYLKKNNLQFDDQYKYDCESGTFYDNFLTDGVDREEVKVYLYKNIFFGFYDQSKYNKRFKELYPITWQSLYEISNSNISLAQRLQNLESELFNHLIPIKSKHYFTLFDAIYFDSINDIVQLNNTIYEFFRNIGISVTTKIEY